LTLCGLAAGSVIIPASIARLIRDKCVLAGEPLIIAPPRAKYSTIYAVNDYGDYTLHFGDPDADPVLPTWQEFMDSRGVDLDHDEERFDFLEQYFSWDRSSGDPEPDIPLHEEIDGGALDFYMEWDFEMHQSPMALAYHYLNDLPLCPGDGRIVVDPLGELDFIEGDRPGSNLTYVCAPDLATIACLQHRLNELNENIHIEIR
ncbi:MAG: hypothetical protein ACKOLA_00390, partial [Spartobacteria bacterium]